MNGTMRDATRAMRLEHPVLLRQWQSGVERQDLHRRTERGAQPARDLRDLSLAAQEHQHVTFTFARDVFRPRFNHCSWREPSMVFDPSAGASFGSR